MNQQKLEIWTVYDHPVDYPNSFVARKFFNEQPTQEVIVAQDVEDIRQIFRQWDLQIVPRFPDDMPSIMEIWL